MDELYFNKVAAALLTVAILYFGLPILVDVFWGGGHHGAHHEKEVDPANPLSLAYPIELELGSGPVEEVVVDLGTLLANSSAAAGERKIALCKSCHSLEKGGPNGTGPNLWNVMGRDIASVNGFAYTGALSALEGQWTYEKMNEYLKNSQAYVPGTAMAQKIRKDDQRANILAYLSTLSDDPLPFPEPAPPAEELAAVELEDDAVDQPAGEDGGLMGQGDTTDEDQDVVRGEVAPEPVVPEGEDG